MAETQPQPSGSPIEVEVRRIEGVLKQGQFAKALVGAQTLLATVPEKRDVLYLIAVAQRYLGRLADALRTLERFETVHPSTAACFRSAVTVTARSASRTLRSRRISGRWT